MDKCWAILYLLGCSIYDFKWKKIPLWILALGGVLGLGFGSFQIYISGQRDWVSLLVGLIPGVCLMVAAWMSEDKIGLGDGLVVLNLGLFLKVELTILAAVLGLFFATLTGVGLMLAKKASLHTAMPFLPFLALGMIVVITQSIS